MSIKASKSATSSRQRIEKFQSATEARNVGTVVSVTDGICRIHGLADARYGEMLEFPGNTFGLALNLEQDSVGAVVLGDYKHIREGDTVKTTGRILEVPVGPELLGRVVDALGQPIDGKGPLNAKTAPDRARGAGRHLPQVREPAGADRPEGHRLHGADRPRPARTHHRRPPDRQDRARHRHHHQSEGHPALSASTSRSARSSRRSRTSCASSKSTAPWRTPSSWRHPRRFRRRCSTSRPTPGCTMGEYFMDNGEDALIIYDDLSKQAVAYRQISLLLRRPPGPRSVSRRRVLSALAPARALRARQRGIRRESHQGARQGQDRLADGAADHRDPGRAT